MDVYAGEPVTATAASMNFNPKYTISYSWSGSGGKISGKDSTASIDTTGLSPGSYTAGATITDGKKGQASCQTSFTIKERPKNPSQVSCSANPPSVMAGTPSTITCSCSSPDNAPDHPVTASIGNWSATGGRISGSGNTATLDTTGASAGPITATATCTDSRGLSSRATASVNVEMPPPPPQASKLNEINFARNSARVDNTAKAILDDVALRLQREADARAVIVGFAEPKELKPEELAAERAANAKEYLVKKAIDGSRIEIRTGSGGRMEADIGIVPAGAIFNEPGTEVVTTPKAIVDTGRDFLLSGDREKPGYGMYSYLLWWDMPVQEDRDRFINVISAFLLMPKISIQQGTEKVVSSSGKLTAPAASIPKPNLNVAYIPINAIPPESPTADWILDHYDIARARILLSKLPRPYRSGPYIISTLTPLGVGLPSAAHYLFQNLSARVVTPELADGWIRQFQYQAGKQEFWKPEGMLTFVLSLRATVDKLAVGIPQARAGLATWIGWLSPPRH